MFLYVTSAKPLDGYSVEVCFDDGREGIADLTEALEGPMFESLKEPDVFSKLRGGRRTSDHRVAQRNRLGAGIYLLSGVSRRFETQATFRKWGYIA